MDWRFGLGVGGSEGGWVDLGGGDIRACVGRNFRGRRGEDHCTACVVLFYVKDGLVSNFNFLWRVSQSGKNLD